MNDDDFWEIIDEPCGATFEIDSVDIVEFGNAEPVMTHPAVELICSLPWGHTPRDQHSDGVTDWIGEVE